MTQEKMLITGETRDEAMKRYREQVFRDWDKLTMAERIKRINDFRCGY